MRLDDQREYRGAIPAVCITPRPVPRGSPSLARVRVPAASIRSRCLIPRCRPAQRPHLPLRWMATGRKSQERHRHAVRATWARQMGLGMAWKARTENFSAERQGSAAKARSMKLAKIRKRGAAGFGRSASAGSPWVDCDAMPTSNRFGGIYEEAEQRTARGEVQTYCQTCGLCRWPDEQKLCSHFVRSEELESYYAKQQC